MLEHAWKVYHIRIFTFHYGSIQMLPALGTLYFALAFTFHYGSIQMETTSTSYDIQSDLHSTMVLFKSINR